MTYEIKLMTGECFEIVCDPNIIDIILDLLGDVNFEYCNQV